MNTDFDLTVLYDGGCPLCSREIDHYRRIDKGTAIQWLDVSVMEESEIPLSLNREDTLKIFHVIDGNDKIYRGASGFIRLWDALPRYAWLSWLCRRLGIVPMMDWAYQRFAVWRFKKRCKDGLCGLDDERTSS